MFRADRVNQDIAVVTAEIQVMIRCAYEPLGVNRAEFEVRDLLEAPTSSFKRSEAQDPRKVTFAVVELIRGDKVTNGLVSSESLPWSD